MYDPNRPAPLPGQMQTMGAPSALPAQAQGWRSGVPGSPASPAGPVTPGGFPVTPGGMGGNINALLGGLPGIGPALGGIGSGGAVPPPAPGTAPSFPNQQRPDGAGFMAGDGLQRGGINGGAFMDALRAWLDTRPRWNGFEGTRPEFRDARMDWRAQRPGFGSYFGQAAPPSVPPMSAPNIAPGEPVPGL